MSLIVSPAHSRDLLKFKWRLLRPDGIIGVLSKKGVAAMKKPTKRQVRTQEVLSQQELPLVDVLRSTLFEAVIAAGSAEAMRMLEEQREALCGPRYKQVDERQAYRHGSCAGSLVMGGRRVTMPRPRPRSVEGR